MREFKEHVYFNPLTALLAGWMETGAERDALHKGHYNSMWAYCKTVTDPMRISPHTADSFAPRTKEDREFHGYQVTTATHGILQRANSIDAVIAFCDAKKQEQQPH